MQLSVACLLPHFFLFNSCYTPHLDIATAYSALLIKLETNARWNSCTQCWQDVVTIKCAILSYMYDPFIVPLKTTNSSTSESLVPVIEYLYPSYSALHTATAEFTSILFPKARPLAYKVFSLSND